jgi:hypothetical protein
MMGQEDMNIISIDGVGTQYKSNDGMRRQYKSNDGVVV